MSKYHDLKPDDFDFPMSYAFRSYVEEQCTGRPLPSIELPAEKEIVPLPETPEPAWTRDQWQYVQSLHAQMLYLQNKVTELLKGRKPKGQY